MDTKDGETRWGEDAFITRLSVLLAALGEVRLHAPAELEIEGLCADTRALRPGELFAALRGTKADGHDFFREAAARGARCVLCETPPPEGLLPFVLVPDSRDALARMAAVWYGEPARKMTMIGVTGTNGKTTTAFLIKQLLEQTRGAKVGLIGTNGNRIGETALSAERTTPDSLPLQRLLARMAAEGCSYVVMEVSSHALTQRRTAGIHYDIAIFTNLTRDHLDYHATMEDYCGAKARLFRQCGCAVVNGDDPWTPRLLSGASCRAVRYGQRFDNDLVGWRAAYQNDRVRFTACDDMEQAEAELRIPGAFSLYNALAALLALRELGTPLKEAARALGACRGVRGRCEVVPVPAPYTVLIDYAHTPDALENILTTVGGFAEGRVLLVFGCGGDRDRGKRPKMGAIAAALADAVVLTSDNPRTEPPYAILHEILGGMRDTATPFTVLEDRREAIGWALAHAARGDVVLLAGKGHETVQITGTGARPFDEREVVRAWFDEREAGPPAEGDDYEDRAGLHHQLRGFGGGGEVPDPGAAEAQGGAEHP